MAACLRAALSRKTRYSRYARGVVSAQLVLAIQIVLKPQLYLAAQLFVGSERLLPVIHDYNYNRWDGLDIKGNLR